MTSGQKVSVSVLISIFIFSIFSVIAFSDLFDDIVGTYFYEPARKNLAHSRLSSISAALDEYTELQLTSFAQAASSPAFKNSFLTNQDDQDILVRNETVQALRLQNIGLTGIRIVDTEGRRTHFSTFPSDEIRRQSGAVSYENYARMNELPYEAVSCGENEEYRLVYDSTSNRVIFSLPFTGFADPLPGETESLELYRGSLIFYTDPSAFTEFLLQKNLIRLFDTAVMAAVPAEDLTDEQNEKIVRGFVLGLHQLDENIAEDLRLERRNVLESVLSKWRAGETHEVRLLERAGENDEADGDTWLLLGDTSSKYGIISHIYSEDIFKFSAGDKLLLLVCVYISLFLIIFLLFNMKHDDMVVIRDRIKKFQIALISEYIEQRESVDWDHITNEIRLRKHEASRELTKSLGRRAARHKPEVDLLLEKSWDEIIAAFGRAQNHGESARITAFVNTNEIREMLEEIMKQAPRQEVSAGSAGASAVPQPKKAAVPKAPAVKAEPIEELEEIEAAEEVEELEEIESAEEVEELEEVEPVEEVEELEEIEPAEPIDETEYVEEIEPFGFEMQRHSLDETLVRVFAQEEYRFGDIKQPSEIETPEFSFEIAHPDFSIIDELVSDSITPLPADDFAESAHTAEELEDSAEEIGTSAEELAPAADSGMEEISLDEFESGEETHTEEAGFVPAFEIDRRVQDAEILDELSHEEMKIGMTSAQPEKESDAEEVLPFDTVAPDYSIIDEFAVEAEALGLYSSEVDDDSAIPAASETIHTVFSEHTAAKLEPAAELEPAEEIRLVDEVIEELESVSDELHQETEQISEPFSFSGPFSPFSAVSTLPAVQPARETNTIDENSAIIEVNGLFVVPDKTFISEELLDADFRKLIRSVLR